MIANQDLVCINHDDNGADQSSITKNDCLVGTDDDNRLADRPEDSAPAMSRVPTVETEAAVQAEPLRVGPESDVTINVGAGGVLIVPREDIGLGLDEGAELDLSESQRILIRNPGRREWIALNLKSELTTRLLIDKPKADGFEEEHFYVVPELRDRIRDELKDVRVFPYYSFKANRHALWIVKVTPDNSWYESLERLFAEPPSFFETTAIRVASDKLKSKYRAWEKPLPSPVNWPETSTDKLLGEALGQERFITSADHPLYRGLTEGKELR